VDKRWIQIDHLSGRSWFIVNKGPFEVGTSKISNDINALCSITYDEMMVEKNKLVWRWYLVGRQCTAKWAKIGSPLDGVAEIPDLAASRRLPVLRSSS